MPNWCYNNLIVKSNGDESSFRRFMEQGRRKETINGEEKMVWRISNYFPTPERLLQENLSENEKQELKTIFGYDNWYDWRLFHWGTKWDCDDRECESTTDDNSIFETSFDSAWSPPIEFLINVSIQYPSLSFQLEYLEPGNQFAGTSYINNGIFLDLCSEPVYKDEKGEIVEVNYDEENEQYVLSNGEVYHEDDWYDEDISIDKNPFEDFNY